MTPSVKPKKGVGNFPKKGEIARKGDPFGRGVDIKPSFSGQDYVFFCILYFPMGRFAQYLVLYLTVTHSQNHSVFSKLEKPKNISGIGIFQGWWGCQEGG